MSWPYASLISLVRHPWRRPLQGWAEELLALFRHLNHQPATDVSTASEIAGCYNLGALIELFSGRTSNAQLLCAGHLAFQQERWREDGCLWRLKLAFQPWVNSYRLAAVTGFGDSARAAYASLWDVQRTRHFQLGNTAISVPTCDSLLEDPIFREFMYCVYLWDSLKSLVKDGLWEQARWFVAKNRDVCLADASKLIVLDEAVTVTLLAECRWTEALSTIDSALSYGEGSEALFGYYRARALAELGALSDAIGCVQSAAQVCFDRFSSRGAAPSDIVLMHQLAHLCLSLGDHQLAFEVALVAHTAASVAGDEVLTIQSTGILASCTNGSIGEYWACKRQDALRATGYAQLASDRSCSNLQTCPSAKAHEGGLFLELSKYFGDRPRE